MARTVGRHRPKSSPRDDFVCMCDYCGVHYFRSKLVRDRAGFLACPKDATGRDKVTLAELEASNAQRPNFIPSQQGGTYETGLPDPDNPNPPPVIRLPPL